MGKTQLAVEYAYRHWSAGDYHFVFWANAQEPEELLAHWAKLGSRLGLAPNDNSELLIDSVNHSLEKMPIPWLIVLDGVRSPAAIRRFFPVSSKGHVLLTSLNRELDILGIYSALHLHELKQSDAVTFLLQRTDKLDAESDELTAAAALAGEELGSLPLALEQAAAYIFRTHCSFAEYLESYQSMQLELLERGTPVNYPTSLGAALAHNLAQLDEKSLEFARVLAFFSEVSVPRRFLVTGANELGGAASIFLKAKADSPLGVSEALQPLFDYALIQRDDSSGEYRMHNMIQLAIRELTPETSRTLFEEVAIRTYNREIAPIDLLSYESPQSELTYGISIAQLIIERGFNGRDAGELLQKLGLHVLTLGNFELASVLLRRSREILTSIVGASDPALAATLLGLALLTLSAEFELAENLYLQVIKLAQDENFASLRLLAQNNLGEAYRRLKRYPEAKALLESSLEGRIKLLGREHTAVSTTLNNLGNWYATQRNYKMALSCYQEAANIRSERLVKPNNLWANSLNNLGYLYLKLNWLKAAEKALTEAQSTYEALYGSESHVLYFTYLNLGELNARKKRPKLSKQFYERANRIQANAGEERPFLTPRFGS